MENIPDEVRAYQQQYWQEQKAKKAAGEANKKINPKEQARLHAKFRKPIKARELESLAVQYGWVVETGNGNHGVHLVNPVTGYRQPLPAHAGRDLATGTGIAIANRIVQSPAL